LSVHHVEGCVVFGWVLIIVFVVVPGMIGLLSLVRGAQLGLRRRRQAAADQSQVQERSQFERKDMATGTVHTVYKDEKWVNEIEGEGRLPGTFKTKAEAMLTGRTHAVYGQTEHVVHNMDGTIVSGSLSATNLRVGLASLTGSPGPSRSPSVSTNA
jgi:hypothetical protein